MINGQFSVISKKYKAFREGCFFCFGDFDYVKNGCWGCVLAGIY